MSSSNPTTTTRGANFTNEEYEAIAKAWMHASEDSIVGAEQKGPTFHKTVHDLYNTVYKPSQKPKRPISSITNKSKELHKECFQFGACFVRVCRMKPSGTSNEDVLKLATAQYNNCTVQGPTDDCGPTFKFLSAWEVFRKHEKFMCALEESKTNRSSPQKSASVGSGSVPEGGAVVIGDEEVSNEEKSIVSGKIKERPVGRRKAKELYVKQQQQEHKIKLAQALVETQKDRNKTLKRQLAIQLFSDTKTGFNPDEAAEFFSLLREEALQDLRGERAKKQKLTPCTEAQSTQALSETGTEEETPSTSK